MAGRLRELWAEGKTAFGAWLMMSTPAAAEMVASMGFDYIGLDWQHGLYAYGELRDVLIALKGIETTPIVRVPSSDPSSIGRALDAGAEGIIVPLVNSRDDAARAAAACRFPPDGERSFGLVRGYQSLGRDPVEINRGVLCFAMIETQEGLDGTEDICTTPGIDGIYLGPTDLALSLGLPPVFGEGPPEHSAAIERVRKACEAADIVPAIHAFSGTDAKARAAQGFRMVTVTADAALLAIGSLTELGTARG